MKVIKRYMTGRKRIPKITKQTTGRLSILWLDWVLIFGCGKVERLDENGLTKWDRLLFGNLRIKWMVLLVICAYISLC